MSDLSKDERVRYSLIIPVYRNEESIPELIEEIRTIAKQVDGPFESVFVVDGSPDRSAEVLRCELAKVEWGWQLLVLSRNYGSFSAIKVGLEHGQGEYFAVMAADLQDPPEAILEFYRCLREDRADVTIGSRASREDPFFSRLASNGFWWFFRKFINAAIPPGGVDIFGCNRAVRDELIRFEEVNSSLVLMLFWVGFRREVIPYSRAARKYGKSGWSFRRKLTYLGDSIFGFTDLPVRLLLYGGAIGILASTALSLVVLVAKLLDLIPVEGYTPVMLSISFFSALQMFSLGVIGCYLWRTFENTKRRPQAIVMKKEKENYERAS